MKRIGILTAGGDTPALNATIKGAVVRANQRRVTVRCQVAPEQPHPVRPRRATGPRTRGTAARTTGTGPRALGIQHRHRQQVRGVVLRAE